MAAAVIAPAVFEHTPDEVSTGAPVTRSLCVNANLQTDNNTKSKSTGLNRSVGCKGKRVFTVKIVFQ